MILQIRGLKWNEKRQRIIIRMIVCKEVFLFLSLRTLRLMRAQRLPAVSHAAPRHNPTTDLSLPSLNTL